MKMIEKNSNWQFQQEPFPAYVSERIYGRNKRDRQILPVKDIKLENEKEHLLGGSCGSIEYDDPFFLFVSTEKEKDLYFHLTGAQPIGCECDNLRKNITEEKAKKMVEWLQKNIPVSEREGKTKGLAIKWEILSQDKEKGKLPILPENQFRVIKTKEKGTILIVPGEDSSNRILLFAGIDSGFRGGSRIAKNTGTLLKKCHAEANCEGGLDVAAILEEGQEIVLRSWGRWNDDYILFKNEGGNLKRIQYTADEYLAVIQNTEEAEII